VSDSGSTVWLWWSVAAVAPECCDEKSVPRHVQFEANWQETTRQFYAYHSLSNWSELPFSLIQ